MKPIAFLITALLLTQVSFGQVADAWIRFYDTKTELSGYKDLKGNIKIPAKFGELTRADTFYHIIAVTETLGNAYKQYYLLKDGKKVGEDSVYVFDFTFDCEKEGKIIFRDRKKDRVGFLDKNGAAIIPAEYNYVSPFHNGIAMAHRNAKRKCWEKGGDAARCEHLGWEGGETILINEMNEVIADSLRVDLSNVNWYSKRINDPSVDTGIYVNIRGKNGSTYSFVDYDKEFGKWFYTSFLPSLNNKAALQGRLFDEVTYWSQNGGWKSLGKKAFLKTFTAALTAQRFAPNKMKEVSISQGLFNEFIFDNKIYKKYLNTCGEHDKERYPLYHVMLTYKKERHTTAAGDATAGAVGDYGIDYQEHFEFLRTENGYRLISVSLKR